MATQNLTEWPQEFFDIKLIRRKYFERIRHFFNLHGFNGSFYSRNPGN